MVTSSVVLRLTFIDVFSNLVSVVYHTVDGGGHGMSHDVSFRNIACMLGLRLYIRFIFEKKVASCNVLRMESVRG